jgi:hypothetical protein
MDMDVDYEDLAGMYAPVWYQDVDASDPDADYITNFDFDGDWDGDNNWQHQNDGYPLKAYIYYSVIETESHWFIMYADFHPRDWGGGLLEDNATCLEEYLTVIHALRVCHENDMEGALVVIRKEESKPYGEFHLMATVFHTGFTFYPDSSNVPFFDDTHPMLYVEPKGHGVQTYDASHFVGDGAVKYVYEAGNAEVPSFPAGAAIPVLASDLKSASISVYLEQEKRDGNQLVPLWSQGRESFQWQRISFYRQILYSH